VQKTVDFLTNVIILNERKRKIGTTLFRMSLFVYNPPRQGVGDLNIFGQTPFKRVAYPLLFFNIQPMLRKCNKNKLIFDTLRAEREKKKEFIGRFKTRSDPDASLVGG